MNLYTLLFSVCLFLSLFLSTLLCHRSLQAPALPVKRIRAPIRACVCSSGRGSVATAAWHHLEGRSAMTVSLSPLLLHSCCRKTQHTDPEPLKLVCQWMSAHALQLFMVFWEHQPVWWLLFLFIILFLGNGAEYINCEKHKLSKSYSELFTILHNIRTEIKKEIPLMHQMWHVTSN